MASSDTAIANSALAKLGAYRIVSLDDNSREAKLLKEQYAKIRDDLLFSHPWNFATTRVSLALLSDTPAFGFDFQYQLPADCLRVLENDDPESEWQIEAGGILVTNSSSVAIRYVKRVTEEGYFSPGFSECFALKLAHDVCYAITQSTALKKMLADEYMQKIKETRSFDGQEGGTRRVYAREWLDSRR